MMLQNLKIVFLCNQERVRRHIWIELSFAALDWQEDRSEIGRKLACCLQIPALLFESKICLKGLQTDVFLNATWQSFKRSNASHPTRYI